MQTIFDALDGEFDGLVELQKELLAHVLDRHNISNGCAHADIISMVDHGWLGEHWWGPKDNWKMLFTIERPEEPPRILENSYRGPEPHARWLAGPPNHHAHRRRAARRRGLRA